MAALQTAVLRHLASVAVSVRNTMYWL